MEKRSAPDTDVDLADLVPAKIRRQHLAIPNLSEHDVVRHFTRLSQMNFGIDTGFYPLGSCTMKFNPKFTEELAALPTVTRIHPDQEDRKSTRLNSSHSQISYAVFCLKKKKKGPKIPEKKQGSHYLQ